MANNAITQMDEHGFPVRNARIQGATAKATFPRFDRQNLFLYDPEQPHEDPNDLLNRQHGKMTDPGAISHNCPFCNRTMTWDLFMSHAEYCFTKWRKVAYRKRRMFAT